MSARPLPAKIEQRLADLIAMGEFVQDEVDHCRATYWQYRDFWHQSLINCFERAQARIASEGSPSPAAGSPTNDWISNPPIGATA